PPTSVPPCFSHDDIVAATDFGTWMFILIDSYYTNDLSKQKDFLWPRSMSKVFKKYSVFNKKPDQARADILNSLNEIRKYRNRLFHHDCIWIKTKSNDTLSSIETIRHKINLIERLIECISPITLVALKTWGVFNNARRICSKNEFEIYTNIDISSSLDNKDMDVLNKICSPAINELKSIPVVINDNTMLIYRMR
ncbi:CAAX protease, partial [Providencia stuartii]